MIKPVRGTTNQPLPRYSIAPHSNAGGQVPAFEFGGAFLMPSNTCEEVVKMDNETLYQMELERLGEILESEVGEAIEYTAEVMA